MSFNLERYFKNFLVPLVLIGFFFQIFIVYGTILQSVHLQNDLAQKEELLRNRAQRELDNGVDKNPIYKLRLKCFTKGVKGIIDIKR